MTGAKIVRICVNKTSVVKNGAAHFRNDRDGVLDGDTGERLPTERLAAVILWTDIAKVKPAQVVCAAEKQTVKNRHPVTAAPGIDGCGFAIQKQDGVIREEKVLRGGQAEAVDLGVATEKAASDVWSEGHASSTTGEKDVVARIKKQSCADSTLQVRTRFRLDRAGSGRVHIEDIDFLEPVIQADGSERCDRFAKIDVKAVIALIVNRTEEIRFVIKGLAA